jgi:hypothetical protein
LKIHFNIILPPMLGSPHQNLTVIAFVMATHNEILFITCAVTEFDLSLCSYTTNSVI